LQALGVKNSIMAECAFRQRLRFVFERVGRRIDAGVFNRNQLVLGAGSGRSRFALGKHKFHVRAVALD
jgi:hypothetical protein